MVDAVDLEPRAERGDGRRVYPHAAVVGVDVRDGDYDAVAAVCCSCCLEAAAEKRHVGVAVVSVDSGESVAFGVGVDAAAGVIVDSSAGGHAWFAANERVGDPAGEVVVCAERDDVGGWQDDAETLFHFGHGGGFHGAVLPGGARFVRWR